jgi:hypothetical protein
MVCAAIGLFLGEVTGGFLEDRAREMLAGVRRRSRKEPKQ